MSSIFSALIVFLPILCVYRSPVPGMDLATCCILLFAFLGIGKVLKDGLPAIPISFGVLVFYLLVGATANVLLFKDLYNPGSLIFLRIFKFIIVPLLCFSLSRYYFDGTRALRMLRWVSFAAVGYIFCQTLIYRLTGILLPNVVMSLILQGDYANVDYTGAAEVFLRPASFFLEPAYFSQYIIVYLIYCLFRENRNEKPLIWSALFCSWGMILSTSGQGIFIMVMCWGIFLARFFRLSSISFGKKILGGAGLLLLISVQSLWILQRDLLTQVWERVVLDQYGGNAVVARTSSYLLFEEQPLLQQIIGVGFGNPIPEIYFSSLSYFLFCTGYIGVILLTIFFLCCYMRGRSYQRMLCCVLFGMCTVSFVFTAVGVAFYFMFILNRHNDVNSRFLSEQSPEEPAPPSHSVIMEADI